MEDEDRERLNIIVALAKTAYNTAISIEDTNPTIIHIVKRLHWELVHLVLEAAGNEQESWRAKVKKIVGSTGVPDALHEAVESLNTVLCELHVDQSIFIDADEDDVTKTPVKQALDSFGSSASTNNNNLTNQQELEQSLAMALKETSEMHLNDHRPSKMETFKFEVKLDQEVVFEDLIGGGVFAKVYAGSYKKKPFKKKQVAIKCLNIDPGRDLKRLPDKQLQQDAMRFSVEAMWADRCSIHPNIVQIYGYHVSWRDKQLMKCPMIIMERMHSTLFQELHNNPSSQSSTFVQRLEWLRGIAQALEFLHLQGIVHHDVKSLNILLNESKTVAKLGDFGITKVQGLNVTQARLSTIIATSTFENAQGIRETIPGTIAYRAPELFFLDIRGSSRVAEMYAFGVTVLECLTGIIPRKGSNESIIRHWAVERTDWPMFRLPTEMMPDQKNTASDQELDSWNRLHHVANCCIQRELSERLTATQVVQVWSQTEFKKVETSLPKEETSIEEEPTSATPVVASEGVVPQQPQSEFYELPRWEPRPTAAEITAKHRKRKVFIITAIVIVLIVFVAPVVAVMGSGAISLTEDRTIGSNETAPTTSPTDTTDSSLTTPSPTSSPVQDCILSNSHLRRAVKDWFDPAGKANVEASLGSVSSWCFGPAVTDMSNLFEDETSFNVDISQWDVSYVTNLNGMFLGATGFNQDLCAWGTKLEGRQVDLDNIFVFTNCEVEFEPDTNANPPGPFCHYCR